MKKSKFSEAQIAFILRQADEGTPVAEVCRKAGISDATFYNWKKRYGGLSQAHAPARGREQPAEEDRRRPDARQGNVTGRPFKKALKPVRRRRLVDEVRTDWKVSIRRACATFLIDTSLYHYKSKRGDQAALKARIEEITATRVRYGYRRVHVLLRREGWPVNAKRIYRLYKELGLQIRNKTPRRRVKAKLREDRTEAVHSNDVWAMDFVHDQLATGRKIRVLTVVDTFSRFSPAVDPRFSYRGEDVVATLERACRSVGYPRTIRVDQGSEFISRDLDLWACQRGVELDFSRPGKPTDNAFIESFNGKFRSECLNAHWFLTLDDARLKMEEWRKDYNTVRPHSAIGNKPPISLMKGSSAASAT